MLFRAFLAKKIKLKYIKLLKTMIFFIAKFLHKSATYKDVPKHNQYWVWPSLMFTALQRLLIPQIIASILVWSIAIYFFCKFKIGCFRVWQKKVVTQTLFATYSTSAQLGLSLEIVLVKKNSNIFEKILSN